MLTTFVQPMLAEEPYLPSSEEVEAFVLENASLGLNKLVTKAKEELGWAISVKRMKQTKISLGLLEETIATPAAAVQVIEQAMPKKEEFARYKVDMLVYCEDLKNVSISGSPKWEISIPASENLLDWDESPPSSKSFARWMKKALMIEDERLNRANSPQSLEQIILSRDAFKCVACKGHGRALVWVVYATVQPSKKKSGTPKLKMLVYCLTHCNRKTKCESAALTKVKQRSQLHPSQSAMIKPCVYATFAGVHSMSDDLIHLRNARAELLETMPKSVRDAMEVLAEEFVSALKGF